MSEPESFLTVMQFANKMRWHPNTVRKMIKTGRLQAVRASDGRGSSFRIPATETERLCEKDMMKLIERIVEEKIEERKNV